MPVTLAQAQVNTQNDIDYAVIDNLRRYSWLFDQIVFDDTVTPGTGRRQPHLRLHPPHPALRRTSGLQPGVPDRAGAAVPAVRRPQALGGAFTLDRVLANLGASATNEVTFQMQQLMTRPIRFQREMILGDTAVNANGFDGLSKALVGSTTEKTAGYVAGSADWTAPPSSPRRWPTPAWTRSTTGCPRSSRRTPEAATRARPARCRPASRRSSATPSPSPACGRWPGGPAILHLHQGRPRPQIEATATGCWSTSVTGRTARADHPDRVRRRPDRPLRGDVRDGRLPRRVRAGVPLVRTWMPDWTVRRGQERRGRDRTHGHCPQEHQGGCGVLRGVKVQ
jgi:hypothetical protein